MLIWGIVLSAIYLIFILIFVALVVAGIFIVSIPGVTE
jgi:hypothetical protein